MKNTLFDKKNIKTVFLFVLGFLLGYFLPGYVEFLFGNILKYLFEIALLFSAVIFYLKKENDRRYFLGGIIASIIFHVTSALTYFSNIFITKPYTSAILAVISIFIFFYFFKSKSKFLKTIFLGIILSISFCSVITTYTSFKGVIKNPDEWDFLCFYLNGKVAAQKLNYYSPESYKKVFSETEIPIEVNYEFYRETVEVAIQYFPQGIFLFLPLSFFDFMTANILWNIFLIIFLIIDVYLIKKIFFDNYNSAIYIFILPIFLLYHAVSFSIYFESYSFVMLFLLLMMWKEKNENLLGLWIAIGIAIKPIMLIFIIYPLLKKKWKAVLYTIIYTAMFILITIFTFGSSTVFSFITENTVQNLPEWSYTDYVNQSLLPTILRITHYDFSLSSPLLHPLFIILGLIISAVSFWLIYKSEEEVSLSITTIYALIIYPSTINHYILLAIPIIFFILKINKESGSYFLILILFLLAYLFMIKIPFLSILLFFILMLYYSFKFLKLEKLETHSLQY